MIHVMIQSFVKTMDEVLHERSATRHFVSVTVQFLPADVKCHGVTIWTPRNPIVLQPECFNGPIHTEQIIAVVKVVRLRDWYLMRS